MRKLESAGTPRHKMHLLQRSLILHDQRIHCVWRRFPPRSGRTAGQGRPKYRSAKLDDVIVLNAARSRDHDVCGYVDFAQ